MEQRICEIKERLGAVTPGAWEACIPAEEDFSTDICIYTADGQYIAQTSYDGLSDTCRPTMAADAEFIAHAKEDILYLLGMVQKEVKNA